MQSLTHVHGDANAEILFLIDGVAQPLVESDVLREPLVRIEAKTHSAQVARDALGMRQQHPAKTLPLEARRDGYVFD